MRTRLPSSGKSAVPPGDSSEERQCERHILLAVSEQVGRRLTKHKLPLPRRAISHTIRCPSLPQANAGP